MPALTAGGPVLVHFFDFAQLNSVRTLPYLIEWDRRYREAGLSDDRRAGAALPLRRRSRARSPPAWPTSASSSRSRSTPSASSGTPTAARAGPASSSGAWAARSAWFHFGEGEYLATEDGDPGRAARARRAALAAGADGAAAPERRARRQGDAPQPRALPRRLLGAALDRRASWRSTTRPAAPTRRSRARASSPSTVDGSDPHQLADRRRRASTSSPSTSATRRHHLTLAPLPGLRIWSVSFAAGIP